MEIEILKWFDSTFHSQVWLNYMMKYITFIGEFGLVPILTALALLIFSKTRDGGFAAAVGLIINVLIVNVILKLSVNRARPWTEFEEIKDFYDQFGIRLPTDSSFPSGHTAACFCVAVTLTFKYKLKGLPALGVAFLVALSRIYLCVHYPTDVLGGMLIGSACGAAGYFIGKFLYPKVEKFVLERILKKEPAAGEEPPAELYGEGENVQPAETDNGLPEEELPDKTEE